MATRTKQRSSATETKELSAPTTLSIRVPDAQAVHVAGTFNQWDPDTLALTRDPDGTWSTTLELPRGRHEYKFIVDGRWCCDTGNDPLCDGRASSVPNRYGTMNHVVIVMT